MSLWDLFKTSTNEAKMKKRLSAFRSQYDSRGYDYKPVKSQLTPVESDSNYAKLINFFNLHARYAGLRYSGKQVLFLSVILSIFGFLLGNLVSLVLGLVTAFLFFYLPYSYLRSLAEKRAKEFSSEYPSVLLAMASNMKAGLTVYSSLERSISLLPKENYIKNEVKSFLEKVSRGVSTEKAVSDFASDINLKELELFRRAFALVIIHGGKFSRTLERLAQVTRDRENLISSSRVSTASMRMTSNVLLVVAPLLLFLLSAKNKEFWPTILNNRIAGTMAIVGALTIATSVYALRRMSDFKP